MKITIFNFLKKVPFEIKGIISYVLKLQARIEKLECKTKNLESIVSYQESKKTILKKDENGEVTEIVTSVHLDGHPIVFKDMGEL